MDRIAVPPDALVIVQDCPFRDEGGKVIHEERLSRYPVRPCRHIVQPANTGVSSPTISVCEITREVASG